MGITTSEHNLIRKVTREFAETRVEKEAKLIDQDNYPRDLIRDAGKQGILTPTIPQEYGGPGYDLRAGVIVLEELSRSSGSFGLLTEALGVLFAHTIYRFGTDHQREILSKVASGELIGAFGLSEPCCGSDAGALETTATRSGGEWSINGHKMWITNGHYADYFLIFARTGSREERHKALTAFLIRRSKCIETNQIDLMGVRGIGDAEVFINDCRAGEDDVVGGLNNGWSIINYTLDVGRTAVSAVALGLSQRAVEESINWAKQRQAFGKPIIEHQVTQFKLASMYERLEAMRTLIYYSAYLYDSMDPHFLVMTHVAKLYSGPTAVEIAKDAVQIHGGYGYSKDSVVERIYRDAKILEIGEGTNEVQQMVLYKLLMGGKLKFEF
jgi:alkylation response protein AidB-like acyl-CoA dehydrogenase